MNPFVNPKKRSISLPSGCKDLVDVLTRAERKHDNPIPRFIHLVLLQAQQDQATEIIIEAASATGGTPIKYKVDGTWYGMHAFPSGLRPDVVAELAHMSKMPAGQFPNVGVLDVAFGGVQLRWIVEITKADDELKLIRVQD